MQVWKYLTFRGAGRMDLPEDAEALSVTTQFGIGYFYILLDPSKRPLVSRWFEGVQTGEVLQHEPKKFIGTIKFSDDYYLHFFEIHTPKLKLMGG